MRLMGMSKLKDLAPSEEVDMEKGEQSTQGLMLEFPRVTLPTAGFDREDIRIK
jgi:hypothetical protein